MKDKDHKKQYNDDQNPTVAVFKSRRSEAAKVLLMMTWWTARRSAVSVWRKTYGATD